MSVALKATIFGQTKLKMYQNDTWAMEIMDKE